MQQILKLKYFQSIWVNHTVQSLEVEWLFGIQMNSVLVGFILRSWPHLLLQVLQLVIIYWIDSFSGLSGKKTANILLFHTLAISMKLALK